MISKNQQKFLHSLQQKKYRVEYQSFMVEGAKSVLELLPSDFTIELLFVTQSFYKENELLLAKQPFSVDFATPEELAKAGTFGTNDAALAVVKTKKNDFLCVEGSEIILVLDDIRDPGNLGTILRIADWYGIKKVICSETTVDFYNPKVIAATMGSFTRVSTYYTSLPDFFANQVGVPVLGTFLDGSNVHSVEFPKGGYLIIGNESNGIGTATAPAVTHRITIPRFGDAESLNAGVATAIVLDNWRRSNSV
ncbi:MAG: RNA methyltransferase [Spirosomataceae bacterium]